jgi:pimeloyl-ACP methyl ester carboxylesterase
MLHRLLNALILLPDRYCYQVPADLGLSAEAVTFPNAQGQPLRGLWFTPVRQPGSAGRLHSDTPVVLFCPGTSGNLSSHLYYIELLCRAGCAVLGFDYTGFGQSAGQALLHTLVTDVLCACDFLRQAQHVEHFGIFGISLGANVALQVAAQRPEIGAVAVEGLALYGEITRGILEHGIMGPRYVTTLTYEGRPPAPRQHHLLNARRVSGWLARLLARCGTACFPFAAKDPRVPARQLTDTPVLCIHGLDDPLLPFEATLQVYEALPGAKQLWLIPEVSHAQEPVLAQDGEYVAQLAHFFHAALPERALSHAPSVTCELEPQGPERYTIRLRNAGPACLVLVTVVAAHALASRTVWVQEEAMLPVLATGQQPTVSCLRLYETTGDGEGARRHATPRGQRYRAAFQPLVRELSRILHERRLHELEPVLHRLPHARPEPPFDFFLGVYCVQIMQRTRHTPSSLDPPSGPWRPRCWASRSSHPIWCIRGARGQLNMLWRRALRWAVGLLGLLLVSCASLPSAPLSPSPFPSVGPLAPADRAQVVQERSAGVQTLTAVLTVSYTIGPQRGTFDLIVNYAAPEFLRFTAFKDTLLSTQVLFDLRLAGETYRLQVHDDAGEHTHTGTVRQFAHEYPTFRAFFVLGEAFFLPGFDGQGQPPSVSAAGTRLTTRLRSGARARWFARADNLEITHACFRWQTEDTTVPLALRYEEYRQVGTYYIPQRVTVLDRRLRFTAQSVLKTVEVNVPLAPGVFNDTP